MLHHEPSSFLAQHKDFPIAPRIGAFILVLELVPDFIINKSIVALEHYVKRDKFEILLPM